MNEQSQVATIMNERQQAADAGDAFKVKMIDNAWEIQRELENTLEQIKSRSSQLERRMKELRGYIDQYEGALDDDVLHGPMPEARYWSGDGEDRGRGAEIDMLCRDAYRLSNMLREMKAAFSK